MSTATASIIDDLKKLSVSDRLEIIGRLWETISPDEFAISSEQWAEYDRRGQECVENPGASHPWNEVENRIKKQLTSN